MIIDGFSLESPVLTIDVRSITADEVMERT
jgi:hypothetical protein